MDSYFDIAFPKAVSTPRTLSTGTPTTPTVMLSIPTPTISETSYDGINSGPNTMVNRSLYSSTAMSRPNYIELPCRTSPPAYGIDPPRPAEDGFE